MTEKPECPPGEALALHAANTETIRTILEFLGWLEGQGIVLVTSPRWCHYVGIMERDIDLANRYLGIDSRALEVDRRTLLDQCREASRPEEVT